MKKKTQNEFVEQSRIIHGAQYSYESCAYEGNNHPVTVICHTHGAFRIIPKNHLLGSGCKRCAGVHRKSADEFIQESRLVHANWYDYSKTTFTRNKDLVTIICPTHGEFQQTAENHLSGRGCAKCGYRSIDQQEFINIATQLHNGHYGYTKTHYVNKHTKVIIECPVHGEFVQSPHNHLAGKGCSKCKSGVSFDGNTFIDNASRIHDEKYDYSKVVYKNAHTPVIIVCPTHGDFEQKPVVHYNHQCGCPTCGIKYSMSEDSLFTSIPEHIRVIRNSRSIIPPLELDGFFPDHNLAIEFCGLHWHSELGGKSSTYHRDKMIQCKKLGIKLITVFEDEWISRPDVVKSRIYHALGITGSSYGARTCSVAEISVSVAKEFLDVYHLQGYTGCSIRLGLYHHDELVSVMTFAKPSIAKGATSKEKSFELSRFASSRSISGAMSKLLRAFERRYAPDHIITYADMRWGDGASYTKVGFVHSHDSRPNYWYFKGKNRLHRFSLRKSPDDDQSLTEWENRQLQGYDRIWDCGHRVFVKNYRVDP